MNLKKYISIPSLFYLLLVLLLITDINYANSVIIEDFESFENELKNSKNYDEVDLVIAKNITIYHKIEVKCNKNVNINITGASSDIYIGWNIYNEEDIDVNDNDIFKIYEANKVILENINIIGNVHFTNINNVIINSFVSSGYMSVNYCDLLINDSIFNKNNDKEAYILILNSSSGSIKNTTIKTSPKVRTAINVSNSKFTFDHVIIKGSFDKIENLPSYHRALYILSSNIQINNTDIENFGDALSNGFMIEMGNSTCTIIDSSIHNGYSIKSSAISSIWNSEMIIQNSKIYDIYTNYSVPFITNSGKLRIDTLEMYNDENLTEYCNMRVVIGGNIIRTTGNGITHINDLFAHNMRVNSILFLEESSKYKVNNIVLNNIEVSHYGAPFTTYNTKGAVFDIENVYMHNIKHFESKKGSLLVWLESYSEITIKNCVIEGGYSTNEFTMLIYFNGVDKPKISISNAEFHNISLNNYFITYNFGNLLELNDINFINCKSNNGIIYNDSRSNKLEINNIFIDGFNRNTTYNDFENNSNINFSSIFSINNNDNYIINNVTTINSSFYYGFYNKGNPSITLTDSKFENNIFYSSAIFILNNISSRLNVENTEFISNIGKQGVILQNLRPNEINLDSYNFKNCIFKNNRAMRNGGIIFTISKISITTFNNCKFINNTAEAGTICFAQKKEYEPIFKPNILTDSENVLTNGISYGGPFVTNPTKVLCNPIEPKSINSGDKINVNCLLLDDYNNIFDFQRQLESSNIEDLVFFKISIENKKNSYYDKVRLKGKLVNYCWNNCMSDQISVIGEEGDYYINFEIIKYGNIIEFPSKTSMEVNIKECNESTHFIEHDIFYSDLTTCNAIDCKCSIHGKCVKNKCSCNDKWTGVFCDINPTFAFIFWPIVIFANIGFIELLFVIVLIVLTIFFREYKEIKMGKPFFLISILIGIFFHIIMIFLIYRVPTKLLCTLYLWLKLMGNAFIYGSIIIKCYQISYLYHNRRLKVLTNYKALLFYSIIVFAHISLLLIWTFVDNKDYINSSVLSKGEIFYYCGKPKTYILGLIFSIVFIVLGLNEVYKARYIPKQFKERLGLPLYAYVIYVLVDIFLTYSRDIFSPNFINSIQCISVLTFCPIVVYNLIFKKVINIVNKFYYVDSNEQFSNTEKSVNQYKTKRLTITENRSRNFEISSIKFL